LIGDNDCPETVASVEWEAMPSRLQQDLKRLDALAFHRREWSELEIRRYHEIRRAKGDAVLEGLKGLYRWMFVPITLWPFNIHDVLADCLAALEKGKRLTPRQSLILDLLPPPPDEAICAVLTEHEFNVQKGSYENLVKTQSKFAQNELTIHGDPELQTQWARIKAAFDVTAYQEHGVIRRTMDTERNLRPSFSVNTRRREDAFQAAFDAFCLRWNLYGMKNDEPLLLKLSVTITPHGTMIHIPSYWSFDPKRDIRWDAIARLHRARVHGRQGAALAEGRAERMKAAEKLRQLDQEALRLGLKGQKKHEFLCAGLGLVAGTSPRRITRLRTEFERRPCARKAE
jgi:hypothetical protein